MFRQHVRQLLVAYCHDELAPAEARHVAEHLLVCQRCRSEYEALKHGVVLMRELPLVPAPDTIWPQLEAALAQQIESAKTDAAQTINDAMPTASPATQVAINAQRRFSIFARWPRMLAVSFAALVLACLVGGWFYLRPPVPSWEVARLAGAPLVGRERIGRTGRLAVGEWLETDNNSRAQISVAQIGQVEVEPQTRIRLIETRPTEHRIELARGTVHARIWAPPRLFFVDTPSAVAADLGCAYTLEVDDEGRSLLDRK